MKRFLWLARILFVLVTTGALADSVFIYYAPNTGSGDNFGFFVASPGMSVGGGGGTPFDFFQCCFPSYAPGSTLGGFTDIFFSGGSATIGGITYDVTFDVGTLFMSTITLPTNGKDYNAPVVISFSAGGTLVDPFQTPISVGGSESGYIDFTYSADAGGYLPGNFVPVPESDTMGLTGAGLIGILALVRNGLRGWIHTQRRRTSRSGGKRPIQPYKLKLI